MAPRPTSPFPTRWLALLAALAASHAVAAGPDDALGMWFTADKSAVIEFKPCTGQPGALCGTIVWDQDAGGAKDTCGVVIAHLERYGDDAWRDGWVYDPRDGKKYKGALRVKSGELHIRAYVGTEILGQTERLQRAATLPAAPVCKR